MRIVTWNLDQGKGASAWPRLQASLGADLVFLQETKSPHWHGAQAWASVPGCDWGSAVLATTGTFRAIPVPGYQGWVVGGEWLNSGHNTDGRSRYVFSVHAPSPTQSQPRRSYVEEVMTILDLTAKVIPPNEELMLGGDFNFVSLGERKGSAGLDTTAAERQALAHFGRLGLVSCWAAAHPGRPLAQTLRWSGDKTPGRSTAYHPDGIFVPASWQEGVVSEVLTSACFEVSDHYPVAAWLCR
jgi:endonuclease/exonuclease/phosphatase family metal-dependent hydrolase